MNIEELKNLPFEDYEGVLECMDELIKHYPDDYDAYMVRADCNLKLSRLYAAKSDLLKAIKIKPKKWEAYFERGKINLLLGKYQKAIEDFSNILNFNPTNPEIFFERARAFNYNGEYAKAVEVDMQQNPVRLVKSHAAIL